MKRRRGFFFIVFLCLLIPSTAFSQGKRISTQAYLQELRNQGKERVIVIFHDEVDPSLVDKYNGKLIRTFTTIKALVCEIPQDAIEPLKQENSVKNVAPDIIVKTQTEYREPATGEMGTLSYGGPVTVRWNNLEAGLNSQAAWDNYNLDGTGIKIAFTGNGGTFTMAKI